MGHTSFKPYPDWPNILRKNLKQWKSVRDKAQKGNNILIATGIGGHVPVATLDTYLAIALTLRGANVHFLLCDEILPACEQCLVTLFPVQLDFVQNGPLKKLCPHCFAPAEKVYSSLGLKVHKYSDYITSEDHTKADNFAAKTPLNEISDFNWEGLSIGEHAKAGALRFYARGTLEDEPHAEAVLRRYFKASLLTAFALQRLFTMINFEAASFHHGIYVPQGIVGEAARKNNIRVANWQVGYRNRSFIFSHYETYHHTLLTEPTKNWENIHWNKDLDKKIKDYLKSRWSGTQDWIWFHDTPQEDLDKIERELGVDFSKPCIGMLTNVIWDAQLHYKANAFPNMLEWVVQTIKYFAKRPDLQLIIRIHPAEVRGGIPSRQPTETEIRKVFPDLPSNVRIISAASQLSTYAVMSQCNVCIVYGTKTGVELTSMGIPVIVAGEAWIRNKGLTMDASSVEHYISLLDNLPLKDKLDDITSTLARKYAFHFFFRRMVPISSMQPTGNSHLYRIKISSLDDLYPGLDPGTDVICDGIMNGTEFIYPAEKILSKEK